MTKYHTPKALVCAVALLTVAACGSDSDATPSDATASSATPTVNNPPADTTATEGTGFPATYETCGHEVTVDDAPTSVVVGWPTIITTLDALGVGDSVIGYTSADFATAPPTDAEPIAPDFRTSREVMIASGLDMFIVNDENQVDASEGNLGWSDLTSMDAGAYVLGGYCLAAPAPTEIDVVYDDIEALGTLFGVTDRATELNDELRERLAAAAGSVEDLAGSSAAVVQAFDGTLYALSGSYYAMIPAALDLESVFGDLGANFAEISPEEVLTLAPEIVIIVHDGGPSDADAAVAEVGELLASSPAIENGRIATVENGVLSGGGVNVVDTITLVADQIAP